MNRPVAGNSRRGQNDGYVNLGYHASGEAIMHIYNNQQSIRTVFDLLAPNFVPDAFYNSAQRQDEHAVTCKPETRTTILQDLRSWADRSSARVCWLSGPAGTGKTTVAHTIAAEYDRRGRLAATFFFWRKTGNRDDIKRLVPTLAYQIAQKIPLAKEAMEKSLNVNDASQVPLRDPISKLSLEDQLSIILITNVDPFAPNLIVIDGLDECSSQGGICKLIKWIRNTQSPFRFLLTSRPEPEMEASFLPDQYRTHTNALILSLTESRDDIRTYFVQELGNLWRKQQRLNNREPLLWPSESDLEKLVAQSEGLFIHAVTAVRHISGKGSPENRLEDVLKLHKGLDNLYIQVIEEASEWDYFSIVMGSLLYLRFPLSVEDLSSILHALHRHMTVPGIHAALHGCHSILAITNDTAIEPYHASLRDFLTDQSRSQTLFHPPATCHGRLMIACLLAITRAFDGGKRAPEYALVSWYYHSWLFLSSVGGSKELEELRDKALELIWKVDLNWVRLWMIKALCQAGVLYLGKPMFPTKDLPDTHWTRSLLERLRRIDGILETFVTFVQEKLKEKEKEEEKLCARPQTKEGECLEEMIGKLEEKLSAFLQVHYLRDFLHEEKFVCRCSGPFPAIDLTIPRRLPFLREEYVAVLGPSVSSI